ncbi:hypothetical protein HPB47_005162 [Ixodes persulcatus]|uniref:Uncharacterized protein n=1 Tax=Ixodes persulcatus TaxID=34615 RepID=A0AC60PEL2_IXOPE|nr:hypothetical protein HPB47_005162 [Ixodes persulcatus]
MSGGSGATSRGGNVQIVGGSDATPLEFPWQISLRISGQHICGGSIINKQHILTAAHCILEDHTSASYYTVVVGDQKLNTVDPNEKAFSIQSLAMYGIETTEKSSELLFNKYFAFHSRVDFQKYFESGTVSNVLQKVDLPTVPYKECKNDYKNVNTVVEETMICADPRQGGKSTCQGSIPPQSGASGGTNRFPF